jgi:hypothetical protein
LALVLAGAFGFRVTALPAAAACLSADWGTGTDGESGHHGHEGGSPASTPPCVCIAHISGLSVALEAPRLVERVAHPAAPARFGLGDLRPRSAGRHLLPFSIGPPALLA